MIYGTTVTIPMNFVLTDILCDTAAASKRNNDTRSGQNNEDYPVNASQRWHKILAFHNPKHLWNAIHWKGNFYNPERQDECPSNEQFSKHFGALLSSESHVEHHQVSNFKYVPVLDDDIQPSEINLQL